MNDKQNIQNNWIEKNKHENLQIKTFFSKLKSHL